MNDLLGVLSAFGSAGAAGEDTNGDGVVDVNDLLSVLSDFGATCAAAPAPAPPTAVVVPPPPAPAPCAQGADCGGQVWNDCGTSCPAVCGTPPPMMCNMMCNAAYQCPNGLQWDAVGMACSSDCAGGGGGDTLPPGVAPGRPFLSAKTVPVFAEAVEQAVSDWMGMVGPDGKHNRKYTAVRVICSGILLKWCL